MAIGDAVSLWDLLIEEGGLSPKTYDKDILAEFQSKLIGHEVNNFRQSLITEKISIERFLTVFFKSLEPFSIMMNDLLVMFEKAGAKSNGNHVHISLNPDSIKEEFKFDIRHFIEMIEQWNQVRKSLVVYHMNEDLLWDTKGLVHGLLRQYVPHIYDYKVESVQNESVRLWLTAYKDGKWPDHRPLFQPVGLENMDHWLQVIWNVWEDLVSESSSYGAARSLYRDFMRQSKTDTPKDRKFMLDKLDSDHFAGNLLISLYELQQMMVSMTNDERLEVEGQFVERMEELFKHVPFTKRDIESTERLLKEFLNLPVWKHRYEIYSAWISTQIMEVLGYEELDFFVVDGTLRFSFSKTLLSLAKSYSPQVQVWSELRTPLINPIGKGRKGAIQPDYSLLTDSGGQENQVRSTILIIECKQYLKASRRNFSNAITDYAKGCPNANVLLVNYGPASESILNAVDPTVRSRVHIIGNMRPGIPESLSMFKTYVKEVLESKTAVVTRTDEQRIELYWGDPDCDLDLHLKVHHDDKKIEINHANLGGDETVPWACLEEDIRSGGGIPEALHIRNPVSGRYLYLVHQFFGDKPLNQSKAVVTVYQGGEVQQFECPSVGEGMWWVLYSFDTRDGKKVIYNQIVDEIDYLKFSLLQQPG
ncbi:hypothetical protein [Paenibacillus piri]|uniref:Uncharacterized protein n=1 Tax=Paenibacillus piri TaxID=2547395 RepID=A0A4R5KK54_9BACL|nr:hypothetical protein [Paenibacillus piri]TDF95921.1 hypothetical protein E1757_19570 [Paenibacillus piri]